VRTCLCLVCLMCVFIVLSVCMCVCVYIYRNVILLQLWTVCIFPGVCHWENSATIMKKFGMKFVRKFFPPNWLPSTTGSSRITSLYLFSPSFINANRNQLRNKKNYCRKSWMFDRVALSSHNLFQTTTAHITIFSIFKMNIYSTLSEYCLFSSYWHIESV
jgi:hypothetical protein